MPFMRWIKSKVKKEPFLDSVSVFEMLGLFYKTWTAFKRRDYCKDCGKLQKIAAFSDGICPSCGSENVEKVVARWLISFPAYRYGPIYHSFEIKSHETSSSSSDKALNQR